MNRVAPIWAIRQNWTSLGLIATTARHAAEYLFRHHAVRMRMIPEQAWTLAAMGRDVYLILKVLARVNMDEDVVVVPFG